MTIDEGSTTEPGRRNPAREMFDRIYEALTEEGLDLSDPAVKQKLMELAVLLEARMESPN